MTWFAFEGCGRGFRVPGLRTYELSRAPRWDLRSYIPYRAYPLRSLAHDAYALRTRNRLLSPCHHSLTRTTRDTFALTS